MWVAKDNERRVVLMCLDVLFFFFLFFFFLFFFFFKQKTAYEIRNCDWSSDVCSSDLASKWRLLQFTEVGNVTGYI